MIHLKISMEGDRQETLKAEVHPEILMRGDHQEALEGRPETLMVLDPQEIWMVLTDCQEILKGFPGRQGILMDLPGPQEILKDSPGLKEILMVPSPQGSLMCLGAHPDPSCHRLKDDLTMDQGPVDPDQEWMGLDQEWMDLGQEWMDLGQERKVLFHVLMGHVHLGPKDLDPCHQALLVQREQRKYCQRSFLAVPWMIHDGLVCEAYWRRKSKKKWSSMANHMR